jgi:SAM-dependent methyltransferase
MVKRRGCIACGGQHSAPGPAKGAWIYRRCHGCGLLWLEPLPSLEQIADHYRHAGSYQVAIRYGPQNRRVYEQLADWAGVTRGERVLDVGCSTGELLGVLAERGADVHGIELQAEAAAIANERLGDGRVVCANVDSTDLELGSFDAVTMMAVLEHVRDPRSLLERVRAWLLPDGRLSLQTPNASSVLARLLGRAWPALAPVEHLHLFTEDALRRLLEREGFAEIRTSAHVKWLPATYVHAQLASYGGPRWQVAFAPVARLFGDRALPFYGGEMLVSARAG